MDRRVLLVRDVYSHDKKMSALVISADETLEQVIKRFSESPGLRGIFLVNKTGLLIGVISRMHLLDWAKAKIGKDISQMQLQTLAAAREKGALAKNVACLLSHSHCVKPEEDISKALELMMEHNLIDVPVVDNQGKILGDITLSSILLKLLNT